MLDLEPPELYVTLDPAPNAHTYGQTRPFIVMTTGLLDVLNEKERHFVVGHELGHIKCSHVLYTMVANNISTILQAIGRDARDRSTSRLWTRARALRLEAQGGALR